MNMARSQFQPGITLRSLAVAVLAVVLMAMHIQYVEVILADPSMVAEHVLPISGAAVFLGLLLLVGGLRALTKWRLLEQGELFCVLLVLLIAAPIMTQGMWHRFVGLLAATPRGQNFSYLDALPDKLWPHGRNLLADRLPDATARGPAPRREEVALNDRRTVHAVVLQNTGAAEVAAIELTVPVAADSDHGIVPGEPYLVSVLARGENFAPHTRVFIRTTAGDGQSYRELASAAEEQKVTFLHPRGFIRIGTYGVTFSPPPGASAVTLAFGLSGPGTVTLADPVLFSVAALEWAYTGRAEVSAAEWAALPAEQRAGLVVKPDRWLSWDGLRYVVTGYIPLRAWGTPALAWSSLIGLLLAATLAVAVLMRRLWADEQRYPFPTFQMPALWLNEESPIWRERLVWVGAAVALGWALLRGWHFYDPRVPDLNVNVALGQYLSDPGWGGMWQVTFGVSAIILSLCLFMELNVLASLVVGFWAYRALFWLGHTTGWDAGFGYPYRYEQSVGAYLGYAAIVVLVSWRHWWALAQAVRCGRWPGDRPEALSPRVAVGLFVATFLGVLVWARWLGVAPTAMLIYFAFLVTIGFVAAKLRAECGLPFGYFTPYNAMLLVGLLGGMTFFGAEAMMVCLIASGFLTVSVFFYIPGLQVELVEFGRRFRIAPRHLLITCAVGMMAGLFVGGWVFLSNAYALGGDTIKYQWAFNQDWFFGSYRQELSRATATLLGQSGGESAGGGVAPSTWAYVYGGAGAVVLTILRQVASGFWLHPIGFVLGSSHLLEGIWGSATVAWVVKWIGLKIGGAEFYRRKLVPLAVGLFLGAVTSVLIFNVYATHLRLAGIEQHYGDSP